MNTIRTPRKRPRRASTSFRTLGWLIVREATLRIVAADRADVPSPRLRLVIARFTGTQCARVTERTLLDFPDRRYFP